MKNFLKTMGLLAILLLPLNAKAATLGLSPGSAELISGCADTISIVIDTEGVNSLATDAFLKYNSNEIEIIDQNTGIPGIQLGIGNAYESYPGNIVSNGTIRLTGFNRSGFFNGRAVLGKIGVKGKPGVTSSVIAFQFSPGNSVDSNVADANSKDVLTSVSNARLTFVPGKCPAPPPPTEKPVKMSEIDLLQEQLTDCQEKLNSLENYYKIGQQEATAALCQGEGLKSAAPEETSRSFLLMLLILLLFSLLLNLDLLLNDGNTFIAHLPWGNKKKGKIKFTQHRIRKEKR